MDNRYTIFAVVSMMLAHIVADSAHAAVVDHTPTWQYEVAPFHYVVTLDALPTRGVLVATSPKLVALSPDGSVRWQLEACTSTCPPAGSGGHAQWEGAVLREDGGAWAIRSVRQADDVGSPYTLSAVHMDGQGVTVREVVLSDASRRGGLHVAQADHNGLVVLVDHSPVGSSTLRYTRLDEQGGETGTGQYALWEHSDGRMTMRLLEDASALVAVEEEVMCFLGCPVPRTVILRIEPTGVLAWRHDFPLNAETVTALELDGSSTALISPAAAADTLSSLGPDGEDRGSVALPVIWGHHGGGVSPLAGGRRMAFFYPHGSPWRMAGLLDRGGNLSAHREIGDTMLEFNPVANPFGFLFAHREQASAELLSATTLETLQRFRFDGSGAADFLARPIWRVLEDGVVYAATEMRDDSSARSLAIARFDMTVANPRRCQPIRESGAAATPHTPLCPPPRFYPPTNTPPSAMRPR